MKKTFSLLFIFNFLISLVFSKTVFSTEGTIDNKDSNAVNNPKYRLEINCQNENTSFFRNDLYNDGVCIVREGEKISINYTSAEVGGGGRSGGSSKKTVLRVKKFYTEIDYNSSIVINKNDIYTVELFTEYSSTWDDTVISEIMSLRILGVDENADLSFVEGIRHLNGFICYHESTSPNYSLAVYCEDASAKISEQSVWYVKKGQQIQIYYKSYMDDTSSGGYSIGSDGQVSSGSGWAKDSTILRINGFSYNSSPILLTVENDMIIELLYKKESSTSQTEIHRKAYAEIKIDRKPPTVTYPEKVQTMQWSKNDVKIYAVDNYVNTADLHQQNYIVAEDSETGCGQISVKKKKSENQYINTDMNGTNVNITGSGKYKIIVKDNADNETEINEIWIDQTAPEIKVYTDKLKYNVYSNNVWTKKDLFIDYVDMHSGIKESSKAEYKATGIYKLWAIDNVGNIIEESNRPVIKIDKDNPSFNYTIKYESNYDSTNTAFTIDITNIKDEHSGIKNISVTPIIYKDGTPVKSDPVILININQEEQKETENRTYTYDDIDRNHDNYISFEVSVSDHAGNIKTVKIGGETGLFIPALIKTEYTETQDKKVKVNFFEGNSNSRCKPEHYNKIYIQRSILLKDKDIPSINKKITAEKFRNDDDSCFETELQNRWMKLTEELVDCAIATNSGAESFYIDEELDESGFTHKVISYDCIYEYLNPVDNKSIVREHFNNTKELELSNNKGNLLFKVNGNNNSYLIINSEGEIIEGSTDSFDMPDTGVVGLEIKIEDKDIEPYKILIQGMVELISSNGKFKLQETDTMPVGTEGKISANNHCFTTKAKPMTGTWANLGQYALQYNITTVFNIELTEGFPGQMEEWSNRTIKLYAKSPDILGGKARLFVGDASSYNADGITARPWQKIKMEILPADENQIITDLTWNFGNGRTSENYGDYTKISDSKFEEIYYEQSAERTGALSGYKLKITSGTDEAEFNINIIDTQFGSLYGNEIWRGEHIIKKEVIVPSGITLQIGDCAHSDKDPDIKCLCVGKIRAEEKGGITVEQGGKLIIDEGDSKTIRFVQAAFKNDAYREAEEKDLTWQNKWKGISIKGVLEGDNLNMKNADCGLTVFSGAAVELSNSIILDRCKNGILMNGTKLLAKEIRCNACSDYGIKLNSKLECENLLISNSGRGLILKENGKLKTDSFDIQLCQTGLQLFGGKIETESGIINGCSEYGMRIEKDGNYNYEIFVIEGNERNIYENGVIR